MGTRAKWYLTSPPASLTIGHMVEQRKINIAFDPALHAAVKAIANKEQRKVQAVADRIMRAGLKADGKVKPS